MFTTMPMRFATILIPVDFSSNTELSIAKALELSGGAHPRIHLLHVQRVKKGWMPGWQRLLPLAGHRGIGSWESGAESHLEQLRKRIEEARPDIQVLTWLVMGRGIEASIMKKAARLHPDLIVIASQSYHLFPFLQTVDPGKLAHASQAAVLTVKPGSLSTGIRKVVVPIGSEFPFRKLEALEVLSKKLQLRVQFVTFSSDAAQTQDHRESIIHNLGLLKGSLSVPVDFEVLHGRNKARSLLKYCRTVDADLLIVCPESETRTNGWLSRDISDLLPAQSKTRVLAISHA